MAVAHWAGGLWGLPFDLFIAVPPALGAGLGYLLVALSPALRRALTPAELLAARVAQRAAVAFLEEEVFATRERTGILIFVAIFERRVVVLGDAGINARVAQHEWDAIVAEIVAGIKKGTPGAAMVNAIRACGALLARPGIERRADDTDELSDHVRLEGR